MQMRKHCCVKDTTVCLYSLRAVFAHGWLLLLLLVLVQVRMCLLNSAHYGAPQYRWVSGQLPLGHRHSC